MKRKVVLIGIGVLVIAGVIFAGLNLWSKPIVTLYVDDACHVQSFQIDGQPVGLHKGMNNLLLVAGEHEFKVKIGDEGISKTYHIPSSEAYGTISCNPTSITFHG